MGRLQTMFNADHQFNDAAATNDGWHKIIHWVQQGTDPIDPLNPTAAAPTNPAGPPITWEQLDTYNVPRPWIRHPNNGNVHCMDGLTEIRGEVTLSEIPIYTAVVVPPANTMGMIYLWNASKGVATFGYYVMDTVNTPNMIAFPAATGGAPATIILGTTIITPALGTIHATAATSQWTGIYQYRVLYRYL